MAEYDLKFRDFTLADTSDKPITFRIGADEYSAPPVIPPLQLAALAEVAGKLNGDGDGRVPVKELVTAIGDVFAELLHEEAGQRFRERLLSRDKPIDLMKQAVPCLLWLMEVYGMRPTEPSSSSTGGLNDGGPGSTDGVSSGVSTP